ncbi:MAG: capsular biosynthesis protein [Planctomycetes bacterium]|nr:capsular biosynthesis protein [Planctomycetota bacterium]
MTDHPPFVDIHCHLIPGIDDGANCPAQALEMARMAAGDGITTVIATPHQLGNFAHNEGATIRDAVARLQQNLDENDVPLRVLAGADVRIEPEMVQKILAGEVLSLADRRRHVLLELPHELYLPLEPVLDQLERVGMVGILSHPERNHGIMAETSLLPPLVDGGCLMQVTAGSLLGTFGPQSQRVAERMLERGLVHFIATDAHGPKSRRPLMRRAFDRVGELTDRETAIDLCCRHPACVAEGSDVQPGARKVNRRGLASWFGRKRAA